jgi:putative glutamine amidotransferase
LVEYGGGCPERQATECALVERADFDAMPMIGVCRGMQLLLHLSGVVLERVEGHTGVEHQLDRTHRVVNCFHRLGALETGNDWTVTATAGGVVEAVEYRWLPRTGIMWHPEREPVPAESDVALFLQRYGVPT